MTTKTQHLRELLEKATPGPWHTKAGCPGRCCWHVFTGMPMYGGSPLLDGDNADAPIVMGECSEDDAAFMVDARNSLPAILDELDALRAEVDQLRQTLKDCQTVAIMRGDRYLADCIDNAGDLYQSAHLSHLIEGKLRAALQGESK